MMTRSARNEIAPYLSCGDLCKPCDGCLATFEARKEETRSLRASNSDSHRALIHAYDDHQADVEKIRQLQEENKMLVEHMMKESKEVAVLKRELNELKDKHTKLQVFSAQQTEQLKLKQVKRKLPIDEQETESEGEILRVPTDREMLEEGQVPETPNTTPRKPARAWGPVPNKTRRRIVPESVSATVANPRFRQLDFDAPAPSAFTMFRPIRPSDMAKHTGEKDCPICIEDMSPLSIRKELLVTP